MFTCLQGNESFWLDEIWYPYWESLTEKEKVSLRAQAPTESWREWLNWRSEGQEKRGYIEKKQAYHLIIILTWKISKSAMSKTLFKVKNEYICRALEFSSNTPLWFETSPSKEKVVDKSEKPIKSFFCMFSLEGEATRTAPIHWRLQSVGGWDD